MNKDIKASLAAAGLLLAGSLAATAALQLGYIDEDAATRIVMCGIGLMVAWYGNRAPKTFVPEQRTRQVTRVSGWSLALSGLVYAALWIFAPVPVALWVGCGAIVAGLVVTFAYCLALRGKAGAA